MKGRILVVAGTMVAMGSGGPLLAAAPDEGTVAQGARARSTLTPLRGVAPEQVSARVELRNEMGKRFKLVESHVVLDGAPVADRVAKSGEELEPSFEALDRLVPAGEHAITVRLEYEGRNVGPFTYLDDYKFHVESSLAFAVNANRGPAVVNAVAHERKGASVAVPDKPLLDITTVPGSGAEVVPVANGR